MPHKPAAFELCDNVGPAAEFRGVVNTIRIETNDRLVGDSFDGGGFLNAARPDFEISLEERFNDAGLAVNSTSLGLHATDALPTESPPAGNARSNDIP